MHPTKSEVQRARVAVRKASRWLLELNAELIVAETLLKGSKSSQDQKIRTNATRLRESTKGLHRLMQNTVMLANGWDLRG